MAEQHSQASGVLVRDATKLGHLCQCHFPQPGEKVATLVWARCGPLHVPLSWRICDWVAERGQRGPQLVAHRAPVLLDDPHSQISRGAHALPTGVLCVNPTQPVEAMPASTKADEVPSEELE